MLLVRPKTQPQPSHGWYAATVHSLLPPCAALGLGTKHSPTESHGHLGFGLNGSPVVQQDLCNSHVSIASCTVERGQLILGREKGSRAQRGQGRAQLLRQQSNRDCGLVCKMRQKQACPHSHCSYAASSHFYTHQSKNWSIPLVHQGPSLTHPASCSYGITAQCSTALLPGHREFGEGDSLCTCWGFRSSLTLVLVSIWAPRSSSSRTMMMLPRREAMCRGVIPFCQEEWQSVRGSNPFSFPCGAAQRQGVKKGQKAGQSSVPAHGRCRGTACFTGLGERVSTRSRVDRSYAELTESTSSQIWLHPWGWKRHGNCMGYNLCPAATAPAFPQPGHKVPRASRDAWLHPTEETQ